MVATGSSAFPVGALSKVPAGAILLLKAERVLSETRRKLKQAPLIVDLFSLSGLVSGTFLGYKKV